VQHPQVWATFYCVTYQIDLMQIMNTFILWIQEQLQLRQCLGLVFFYYGAGVV